MAKRAIPAAAPKAAPKTSQLTLWLSIGFVAVIIMSLPTVIIVFFGLLPTIVAYIIDRTDRRSATSCVGGVNFCGVFPFLMQLWSGDNSIDMSIRILTDVFSLAVMYGAAAFGWMIFMTLSPVIAAFLSVMAQHKVSNLRTTQRQLIEEWGEDVAAPQEVLDMRDELAASEEADSDQLPEELDVDNFLEGIDSILESSTPDQPAADPEDDNPDDSPNTEEPAPRSATAGS